MNLEAVLIGGLITYRLSHMLVKDKGPLMVFTRLRAFLATKQKKMGGVYDMITCIACVSIWLGAMTAIAFAGDVFSWLGYTLAFSSVSLILERLSGSKS